MMLEHWFLFLPSVLGGRMEWQGAQKWLILLVAEPPAGLGALTGIRDTQRSREHRKEDLFSNLSVQTQPRWRSWADSCWEAQDVLSRTVAGCRRELPQAQLLPSSADPGEGNIPSAFFSPSGALGDSGMAAFAVPVLPCVGLHLCSPLMRSTLGRSHRRCSPGMNQVLLE